MEEYPDINNLWPDGQNTGAGPSGSRPSTSLVPVKEAISEDNQDSNDSWSDTGVEEKGCLGAGPSGLKPLPGANHLIRPKEAMEEEYPGIDNLWPDDLNTGAGPSGSRPSTSLVPVKEAISGDNQDSDDSWPDAGVEEKGCPGAGPSGLKPLSGANHLIRPKEEDHPSSSSCHLKQHFIDMGFSPTLVQEVIEQNGEDDANLILHVLLGYTESSPIAADQLDVFSSSEDEENNSPVELNIGDTEDFEEFDEASVDKKKCLLMMDFSEEEVDRAINELGEGVLLEELVDFIVAGCSGEEDMERAVNEDHRKNEESAAFGIMDKTFRLLQMGFTEAEVSSAIDSFGAQVPIWKLADSVFADRYGYRVRKEEDLLDDSQKQSQAWRKKRATRKRPEPSFVSEEAEASNATPHAYAHKKRGRKAECKASNGKAALSKSGLKQAKLPEEKTSYLKKSVGVGYLKNSGGGKGGGKMVTEESSYQSTPITCGNGHDSLTDTPYFFYGSVVDAPDETWQRLSQFLYGVQPEHANSQHFSALIRKEGYFHNLPIKNRFHILPNTPKTIEDALPQINEYWPLWDTRKQLSFINPDRTNVVQQCERLGKMMAESQGPLSKEQQADIVRQCKALNLIWVGQNKLRPIGPEQVESILGYPMQHTEILGPEAVRLRALEYCFQTDTLSYHLSVLKDMYPDGLRVMSVYSGIGGVEVALDRLGIRLSYVVSVEASDRNQRILRRWWDTSGQSGELIQIKSMEFLTIQKLESYINQFGGFDIIVGRDPTTSESGASSRNNSVAIDQHAFFEFARVYQRVKSVMGG